MTHSRQLSNHQTRSAKIIEPIIWSCFFCGTWECGKWLQFTFLAIQC